MATAENEVHAESEVVKLSLVKLEEVKPETMSMVETAEAFIVDSDEAYSIAQQRSVAAHKRKKDIEAAFKPMKDSAKKTLDQAKKTHDEVKALIKRATDPCTEVKEIYGRKTAEYRQEQERIRQEDVRRRELAAKKAEEERLLAEAEHADAIGDEAGVDAALERTAAPVFTPLPAATPVVPKAKGMRKQVTYGAMVTDLMQLVKAVAAGQQPITYLQEDQASLNGAAKSQKEAMNIPGVRLLKEEKDVPTGR